jgi:hypothetical protein
MRQFSAWFGSTLRMMALLGVTLIAITAGGLGVVRQN